MSVRAGLLFLALTSAFYCNFDSNEFCTDWNGDTLISEKKWKILNQNRVGTESFGRPGGFASFQSREPLMSSMEAPIVQLLPDKGTVHNLSSNHFSGHHISDEKNIIVIMNS